MADLPGLYTVNLWSHITGWKQSHHAKDIVNCPACLPAAYKVSVKSSTAEGDFMTYTATIVEVLKNTDKGELSLTHDQPNST